MVRSGATWLRAAIALALLAPAGHSQQPTAETGWRGRLQASGKVILSAPATGTVGQIPVEPGQTLAAGARLAFISAPALALRAAERQAEMDVADTRLALAEARRALVRWEIGLPALPAEGPSGVPAGTGGPTGTDPGAGRPPAAGLPTSRPAPDEGARLRLAIADREVVVARSQVRAAQARLRTAEAARDATWLLCPLPRAKVLRVLARKGAAARAGETPLVEIALLDRFEAVIEIPLEDWVRQPLTVGQELLVGPWLDGSTNTPRPSPAKVMALAPIVGPGNAVRVTAALDAPAAEPSTPEQAGTPPTWAMDGCPVIVSPAQGGGR